MYRYGRITVVLILGLFLPLTVSADGRNKPRHKQTRKAAAAKVTPCAKQRGKARKACSAADKSVAKAKLADCKSLKGKAKARCSTREALAAKREAQRQARIRAEAERRRLAAIAFENSLHKITADNIAKDDTTGENLAIRAIAVDALGSTPGAVVVMETKTGKIETIVNQDWTIRKGFAPCSTIKLCTTVAGLNANAIDEDDEEDQEDLEQAIAHSSNSYFQKLGSKFDYQQMVDAARKLGLGKPTGINAKGESSGKLPLVKKTGLVYSHGYGFEVTPLQEAVMVSTIANGGKKVTPFIAKTSEGKTAQPRIETVSIPAKDLQGAIPGMKGTAEYGTAHRGVNASLGIAGKTGTCSMTGYFTSVAPINDPQYTVVVLTRGAKGKGKYASAIAGRIYQKLLGTDEPATVASKPAEPNAAKQR